MVTEYPLACNNLANEAEIIPFPSEEATPPVTKMYLAGEGMVFLKFAKSKQNQASEKVKCLTSY
jgi:hypothetical protein